MASSSIFRLYLVLLSTVFAAVIPFDQDTPTGNHTEASAERTFFYVGGQYVNSTSVGPIVDVQDGSSTNELMKPGNEGAEYMIAPFGVHPWFRANGYGKFNFQALHLALSPKLQLLTNGQNWLNTPDGREGWASYFLRQGYVVYLTDQPERGRSPYMPGSGELAVFPTAAISSLFTAPGKVVPLPYPQAALHTQWPGTGLPGDPVFDAFYSTQVQFQANGTIAAQLVNNSYVALADRIATPHILVTHSQAGPFGWQLANERPDLVAGIVAIEPGAGPFETWTGPPYAPGYASPWPPFPYGLTALPLLYDPPLPDNDPNAIARQLVPPAGPNLASCILQAEPARRLPNIAKVPVLQIVGEASFQAVYSGCIASYLEQAGVDVEFVRLEERGVRGNGHFSFMEKNSIQVVEKVVVPFLDRVEKQ